MAGLTRTGTSFQQVTLVGTTAKVWQHNRGVKALAVQCFDAVTGAPAVTTNPAITQATVNAITLTPTGNVVVNVLVVWGIPTTVANSIRGVKGATAASVGFV